MPESPGPTAPRAGWYGAMPWLGLAGLLIAADQWTKHLVSQSLTLHERIPLTGFFNLTLTHNTGAAFSFLSEAGGWQRWLFSALAAGVSVVIVVWLTRLPRGARLLPLGLTLVLAGALGNLWDRVTLGVVVDFLDFHYGGSHWPAFNVADSAITVGAGLLLLESFRGDSAARESE